MLSLLTAQAIEHGIYAASLPRKSRFIFRSIDMLISVYILTGGIPRKSARTEVEHLPEVSSSLTAQDTRKDSRDVLQLPHLQSQRWQMKKMLNGGISEKGRQVELAHDGLRWSGVHASDFNPGSVTFVWDMDRKYR
jgi:hypothetical protein